LLLRYVLETCDDVGSAARALERIPIHMSYNIAVVDRKGRYVTAYLSPDRPAVISDTAVSTNHQEEIEWDDYARATTTVERRAFIEEKRSRRDETEEQFIEHFLHPPLYSTRYEKAFGTLYTAAYFPESREVEYRWPHRRVKQSFSTFAEGRTVIKLKDVHAVGMPHT
jgi:predicted choloylglycine hydrolase